MEVAPSHPYFDGGIFVAPICTGIAIGRFGCLFSGLPDQTYGTPTALPWAVNLGDGIGRHPVQIYESLTIVLFLLIWLRARHNGWRWACVHAFHAMIIVYATQRFLWEFLKPYPTLVGLFNLFHFLMLGLIIYGLIWWRRENAARTFALPAPCTVPVRSGIAQASTVQRPQIGVVPLSRPDDQSV